MANSNLHAMQFLGLTLEDDFTRPLGTVRFRMQLTAADAWDGY
ncbi:hypothetical protein [Nitrosomonas sp. Nm84]|nr:hypothetical protein [Nitrosomonas sp. Nm84]